MSLTSTTTSEPNPRGALPAGGEALADAPDASGAPPGKADAPWRAGVAAARANAVPGVVLSAFAIALLLAYWYLPTVQGGMAWLAELKVAVGWPFGVVSTAVFGGIIPWAVQRLRPAFRAQTAAAHLVFFTAFWAYKGLEVDLLYLAQAWLFGEGATPGVVAIKVLVDMGVYVPLWAVPTTILAYRWKDTWLPPRGAVVRDKRLFEGLGFRRWYMQRTVPLLISNWAVWTPAVCVIYCLPTALQLPVQNLVLCFWSLLLVLQVSHGGAAATGRGRPR